LTSRADACIQDFRNVLLEKFDYGGTVGDFMAMDTEKKIEDRMD